MFLRKTFIVILLWLQAIPASAQEPFDAEEIAPGIFVIVGAHEAMSAENLGHIANMSFVIGARAVAVIDTGGSAHVGRRLLATIRAHTSLPIAYVINTHMHPDHVFGNAAFEETGAEFVGHQKLSRALAARGEHYLAANRELLGEAGIEGVRIVPPTLGVESDHTLDLGGGRMLELIAHPTAHTDNDISVYDPSTQTMWLGDLLFSGHLPAIDGSLVGWLALIEHLKADNRAIARVVPGHGPAAMEWPEALEDEERYLRTLAQVLRALIAEGGTLTDALERATLNTERSRWSLFELYHWRNVTTGFAELEWE